MYLERSWPESVPDPKSAPAKTKRPAAAAPIPKPPPIPANLFTVCPLDMRLDTVTR